MATGIATDDRKQANPGCSRGPPGPFRAPTGRPRPRNLRGNPEPAADAGESPSRAAGQAERLAEGDVRLDRTHAVEHGADPDPAQLRPARYGSGREQVHLRVQRLLRPEIGDPDLRRFRRLRVQQRELPGTAPRPHLQLLLRKRFQGFVQVLQTDEVRQVRRHRPSPVHDLPGRTDSRGYQDLQMGDPRRPPRVSRQPERSPVQASPPARVRMGPHPPRSPPVRHPSAHLHRRPYLRRNGGRRPDDQDRGQHRNRRGNLLGTRRRQGPDTR